MEEDGERVEKTGWIKSKAAFRCLHASRLNEDQSRARSSKQDDWPRVGLGYGRGAHDKNGATRRRGWPLLFSHKCRVCDAPPPSPSPQQTAPVYSPEKHRSPHSPPHLLPVLCRSSSCIAASPSPLDAATLFRDWEARISRFNSRPGVIICDGAGIDGWHENGFGIVRGHVDDRSKDFRGFRGSWRDTHEGLRSLWTRNGFWGIFGTNVRWFWFISIYSLRLPIR